MADDAVIIESNEQKLIRWRFRCHKTLGKNVTRQWPQALRPGDVVVHEVNAEPCWTLATPRPELPLGA